MMSLDLILMEVSAKWQNQQICKVTRVFQKLFRHFSFKSGKTQNSTIEFKIELLNNKLHGLSPPGGLVSLSGGFALLLFDQRVPYYSQRHLADWNAICILHRSDCAWLCC
jgi:hypothetical protein